MTPVDSDAYAAGGRAGIITAVPLSVWFLFANVERVTEPASVIFSITTVVLVVASVLGLRYIAGGLSAGISGWLAVQFGRKEPA